MLWLSVIYYDLSTHSSRLYFSSYWNIFAKLILIKSGFHKGVAFAGWTPGLWMWKDDELLHTGKQTDTHMHTQINNAWCTSCTHADFWQAADLSEWRAKGDTSFLTLPVREWWWLSAHLPGFANEREEFGFVCFQRHQNGLCSLEVLQYLTGRSWCLTG